MLAPRHLALRYTDELPQDAAAECGFPCAVWRWPTHHPEWCWEETTPLARAMSVAAAVAQLLALIGVRSPSLSHIGHRLSRHTAVIRALGSLGLYKPYSILRAASLFPVPTQSRPCSSLQLVALITPRLRELQEGFAEPQTPDSRYIYWSLLIQTSLLSSWGWPPSAGKQVGGQPYSEFDRRLPFWLTFPNHWLSWSIPPQGFALRAQRWPLTGTRKPKVTTLRAQKGTYSYGWHFSHSFQVVYPNSRPNIWRLSTQSIH